MNAGVGLVLGGAMSVQFGSAVAALLFPRAGAAGVVMLRLLIAAVLLLAVCRPRLRGHSRGDWQVVAGFGIALAGMNTLFYQAIDRIPLGPAVTLEVLGPLTLSVIAARRKSSWLWAGLALCGVILLGYQGFDRLDPAGAAFALGAGVMWAGYIVFSARAGQRFPKTDGLALAMGAAALLSLPLGARPHLLEPVTLGLGTVVALMSSVLPYTLELRALRRLPTSTFAVLMSLGPALAVLAGWTVLGQRLSVLELLAVALVITASVGAVRSSQSPSPDDAAHGSQPPASNAAALSSQRPPSDGAAHNSQPPPPDDSAHNSQPPPPDDSAHNSQLPPREDAVYSSQPPLPDNGAAVARPTHASAPPNDLAGARPIHHSAPPVT